MTRTSQVLRMIHSNRLLYILGLSLVLHTLYSCGTKDNTIPETKLTISSIYTGVDVFSLVGASDSVIIGYSLYDTQLCRVYSIENEEIKEIGSFLRKGRAKNEVLTPIFSCRNDTVYVTEIGMKGGGILRIPINDYDNENKWTTLDLTWADTVGEIHNIESLGNDRFLVATSYSQSNGFLYLIDCSKKESIDLQYTIEDGCDHEAFTKALIYSNNSGLLYKQREDLIAYTCGEGKYFEIASIKGGELTDRRVIHGYMPKYNTKRNGSILSYELQEKEYRGIMSYGTENRIYLGYLNNRTRKDGYPKFYMDIIDVFDWEGNLLSRLRLEKPFACFVVTNEDHHLYSISTNQDSGETEIHGYLIPK